MGVGYTDKKDTIATERPGFMLNKARPVALTGSLSCKKSCPEGKTTSRLFKR